MSPDLRETVVAVPGMDCVAEEQLVRSALAGRHEVGAVEVDLGARTLTVVHDGPAEPVVAAVAALGLGSQVLSSRPWAGPPPARAVTVPGERRTLVAVLLINATMCLVELVAGWLAGSTGLLADALDMGADAAVYGIALAAVGGAQVSQRRSARISGWLQLGLAGLVLVEVARRLVEGEAPQSGVMILVGGLALLANVSCVALLSAHRRGGVHLRASWIFSTNDALANLGVIVAGQLVAVTGSAWPDLLVGTAIAVLVASGALRILRLAG